jgi:hypothetical protein
MSGAKNCCTYFCTPLFWWYYYLIRKRNWLTNLQTVSNAFLRSINVQYIIYQNDKYISIGTCKQTNIVCSWISHPELSLSIWNYDDISGFFYMWYWVRQGENVSPFLFSIVLADLEDYLIQYQINNLNSYCCLPLRLQKIIALVFSTFIDSFHCEQ